MRNQRRVVAVNPAIGIGPSKLPRTHTVGPERHQWNEFDLALLCGLLDIYEGTGQDTLGGGF